MSSHTIRVTVNGTEHEATLPARLTLADFLREHLDLTATHLGCEHGVCGACTVLLDGETARACITLAAQVDGAEIVTLEGIAGDGEELHPVQQAFWDRHGMQCCCASTRSPRASRSTSPWVATCAGAPAT